MSTQQTTTCRRPLGAPSRRALLGSVAAHAVLLLGLLQWRTSHEPADATRTHILVVDLVRLPRAAAEDSGRVTDAELVATVAEPARGAPPAVAASAPPDAGIETEEPQARHDPPEPRRVTMPEAAPEPDRELALEPYLRATLPRPTSATLPEVTDQGASLEALEQTGIERRERRMLERRIAEWSAAPAARAAGALAWEHDGATYRASFTPIGGDDVMGIERLRVAVTSEQDGRRATTHLYMKRMAFSSFAQFVDRWDPGVQIHDDRIDGRFHSNSGISIASGDGVLPAFLGKVTTARSVDTSASPRRVPRTRIFQGGLETGVPRIALPRDFVPLPDRAALPPEHMLRLARPTRITFSTDGSFVARTLEGEAPELRVALPDVPYYLLADEGVSLHVSGVVRGKVLVHAPKDIVIENDLRYARDPANVPDSGDYLGLVAGRDVVIADPRTTGPGDLTIQAAIYAMRRFTVRHYSRHGRDTLYVYGSIAAGSLSATEPRYRTRLEFDRRFEDARPPGFPQSDRYEVVDWDGLWTSADGPATSSNDSPILGAKP